jgi:hypothetical protein
MNDNYIRHVLGTFRLKGAKLVAKLVPLPDGEMTVHVMGMTIEEIIANPIAVEQPSQDE